MSNRERYGFTLNLKDDPELIEEYEAYHKEVWPEVEATFEEAGIVDMEIYRYGTRLFMFLEVDETFSFETWDRINRESEKVQEWEELMWQYQAPLEDAEKGEKWKQMKRIYDYSRPE